MLWHDSAPALLSCENAMTTSTTVSPTAMMLSAMPETTWSPRASGEPATTSDPPPPSASTSSTSIAHRRLSPALPLSLGNEAAGVIEAVGARSRT
jgi:hypothetical protein